VLLELPSGRAPGFAEAMRRLMLDIRRALPQALKSEQVAGREAALVHKHAQAAAGELERYRDELRKDPHVVLKPENGAFSVVPARGGEPLAEEAWRDLPATMREEILRHQAEATDRLAALHREMQRRHEETQARVTELHREAIRAVVEPRVAALAEDYAGVVSVISHLDRVRADVLERADHFLAEEEGPRLDIALSGEDFFRRYEVNVLVTQRAEDGAPVVEEDHPTLKNLMGQVGGQVRFGVMVTDFTRIVAGAVQRASGGYLLLDAAALLAQPFSWGALKRALRTGRLRPGDPAAELGFSAPDVLDPEPLVGRVKLVLVGEPHVYYLLQALDPDFAELVKVKVDFSPRMERTPANERAYSAFLARQCRELTLPPLDAGAVARVVEQGSRWAGDQRKLTTRFRDVRDLLVEASHGRATNAAAQPSSGQGARMTADDVDAALRAREARERRPQRELLELIERGVLAFEPSGSEVGQLHGIALVGLGDEPFGRPIRVIASAFLGAEGVVNIEREAKLSGPIHNKGFLVLSGYLGRSFARRHPLLLSASLSFDQLYEEVEGDSASAAELFALLSAIGEIPLRQGIAVTGAINQEGTLLPVGGVTQKVEGFFAACARKGLTGEQGVLLPLRNVENLCLGREVRAAAQEGRFHVWAVDKVEEGWPILAGLPAGAAGADGTYPSGTVHHAVQTRLDQWARQWRALTRRPGAGKAATLPGVAD
jgi:predicted ATP-dependent protease